VLKCESNLAKQMLFLFHKHCVQLFNDEQLDFLVAVTIFKDFLRMKDVENNKEELAKHVIAIINTYCERDSIMYINVESTHLDRLLRFKYQLQLEVLPHSQIQRIPTKESVSRSTSRRSMTPAVQLIKEETSLFEGAFESQWKMMLPIFIQFLNTLDKKNELKKYQVQLPFHLQEDWMIQWDEALEKETMRKKVKKRIGTAAPRTISHMALLSYVSGAVNTDEKRRTPSNNALQLVISAPPESVPEERETDVGAQRRESGRQTLNTFVID